jgi:predicted Zn-dependent peptidase
VLALVAALVSTLAGAPPVAPESASEPAVAVASLPGDPIAVKQVVLDNGFTVFLTENHERPEIFGAVVVRTGAKNDPPDNTGMAHYLEHMLFKGTTRLGTTNWKAERPLQERLEALYERLKTADAAQAKAIQQQIRTTVGESYAYTVPNELDQLLEEFGGTGVNAFTTYDETVYHNTFPASQIEPWLDLYSHRFVDPVFRLFPTELEAVYEEKNIAIDTLGYELFRRFMRAAFPGHAYGQNDILGEVEHLKKPSLRAMRAYFDKFYVPSNMALVLSGDFDTEQVLPLVQRTFGAWEKKPAPQLPERPIRPFAADERLKLRLSPVRVGGVAFRTVPESHPDYAALLLARRLLSNQQRSGFIDRLGDTGKLLVVFYVPADFSDHNLDVVAYVPRILTQSFRRAERLVLDQFAKVARGEFDDATLRALKQGLIAEETARWEDNQTRALAVAHAFVAGGWEARVQHLRRLPEVTRADVMRVAQKYFGERRLVVRSRMGFPKKHRLEKPKYPSVKPRRGAHSEYFEALRARETPAPRIDYVDFDADVRTLPVREGVTLRVNDNPLNDLYHLELRYGVGHDTIRELQLAAKYLERIGSESTPSERFRRRLFALSTKLTVTSEPDRFIVRIEGPQQHMEEALVLVSDLLQHPKIERKPLRQLRREVWGYRRFDRKDVPTVGRALRDHVLYRDDSPRQQEYGPTGARFTGPRALLRAVSDAQDYAVEVRYVGRKSAEQMRDVVARVPFRLHPGPAVDHVVYARQLPPQTTVYFVPRRDAVQTQLWFAVEGDPVGSDDQAAADAFEEYFGGSMAGLVFQEVREFRALAYATHGSFRRDENPAQKGHLLGYVGCQADKTGEAIEVMLDLITDMPRKRDRIGLVRSALIRGQEVESPSFRELQDKIEEWGWHGHREDPRLRLGKSYAELDFDDVERFWTRHVAGRPVAIMVVGDPRKVKPRALEKYGKVVRVREGALFSP